LSSGLSIERDPKRHEDHLVVKNDWAPTAFDFQDGQQNRKNHRAVSLSTSMRSCDVRKVAIFGSPS